MKHRTPKQTLAKMASLDKQVKAIERILQQGDYINPDSFVYISDTVKQKLHKQIKKAKDRIKNLNKTLIGNTQLDIFNNAKDK